MRRLALGLALLPVLACMGDVAIEEPVSLWSSRDVVPERTFLREAVDTLWKIGGKADTTLLNPMWLDAGDDGVTVWDEGRKAIVRISRDGSVQWSFGREGDGPGEFRTVRGIAHLAGGGAAAVDVVTRRLTLVDPNGGLVGQAGFDAAPFKVSALPDGGVVVLIDRTDPFVLFDESGTVAGSAGFPWKGYAELSTIARQGRVQGVRGGWVFGFTAGNGWWRFREGGGAEGFPYAEHTDFPVIRTTVGRSNEGGVVSTVTTSAPATKYVSSALGFGVRGDTLFVHYGGGTRYRWRLLDRFRVDDGTYLGSARLPLAPQKIAVGPDAMYALTLEARMYPTLTALRRHAKEDILAQDANHKPIPLS